MFNIFTEKIHILLLITLSLLFSILFFNDQVAVRGGLVISDLVSYKDNISPLKYYFLNSWTILTQLSALFLKIGFSVKITSLILVFVLTFLMMFSSFLILQSFTRNKTLSLITTVFLIFFQKNLGDTDYPSLMFTIHTFGAYAQALTGILIASLLYRNYNLTFFLSILLISIHPIIGLWLFVSLIMSVLLIKEKIIIKEALKGISIGLIFTLISLVLFFNFSIDKTAFDQNLFDIYLNEWDGHRAKTGEIHYEYIIKTLLFFSLTNLFLYNKKTYRLFLTFLNLIIATSLVIYLVFKFSNFGDFGILSTIIPGRFMITYTFIAWPIVVSLLYLKLGKKKYFKNFLYSLILLYSLMHYKDFIKIYNNLNKSYLVSFSSNSAFKVLNEISDTGNVIATENSAFNVLYLSRKPLLITRSIDFLPYHPYLVNSASKIFSEVYGYNFNKPKKKHYPYLNDNFIKEEFEKKTFNDWVKIKNNFNSKVLITPSNWKINLKLYYKGQRFSLYLIN